MAEIRRLRRGSVLMEFIVVAPLYFALLGGMYFVGELMLNRYRLAVGDHLGTWLAGTRLMDRSGGNDAIGGLFQDYLFRDTHELAGQLSIGRDTRGMNYFMSMYGGGIKRLSISVPNWIRGMLYMHQAFSGGDMDDLKTKRTFDYFKDADYHRSFSFHRSSGWPSSHNRAASAFDIVNSEILANVLGDTWILSESNIQQSGSSNADGGYVVRALSEWSE